MTQYKTYTDRVLTLTPTVLAYRLKQFCLGHSMLLRAANSKFIDGTYNGFLDVNNIYKAFIVDKELLPEFVFAVLVCSTTYKDFQEEIANGDFVTILQDTIKDLDTKTIVEQIHTFAHYLKNGTNAPEYMICDNKKDDSVKGNVVSFEENILSTLMSDCGYTRDECINLPLTETLSAYLLYAHRMGSIELTSKEVFDMMNKAKGIE